MRLNYVATSGNVRQILKFNKGSSRKYILLLKSHFSLFESDQVGFTVCKITFIGLSNA